MGKGKAQSAKQSQSCFSPSFYTKRATKSFFLENILPVTGWSCGPRPRPCANVPTITDWPMANGALAVIDFAPSSVICKRPARPLPSCPGSRWSPGTDRLRRDTGQHPHPVRRTPSSSERLAGLVRGSCGSSPRKGLQQRLHLLRAHGQHRSDPREQPFRGTLFVHRTGPVPNHTECRSHRRQPTHLGPLTRRFHTRDSCAQATMCGK